MAVIFSQWVLEYLTVEEAVHTLEDCTGSCCRGPAFGSARLTSAQLSPHTLRRATLRRHRRRWRARARFWHLLRRITRPSTPGCFVEAGSGKLFDRPTVEWMLVQAGFTDIRFWKIHEGQCPDLLELEHEWIHP